MRTTIVFLILFAVVWFAVTNTEVVTVQLFTKDVHASLALVVFVSFGLGFLLGVLRITPGFIRRHMEARTHKKALDMTTRARDELAEKANVLEGQVKRLAPEVTSEGGQKNEERM